MNAQSVDGLPSGYMRFLLDLDGKSPARRHGFKIEGTLTTKGLWGKKDIGSTISDFEENIYLKRKHLGFMCVLLTWQIYFLPFSQGFSYLLFPPL